MKIGAKCEKCQVTECRSWVNERPEPIQAMIAVRPVCAMYLMKSTAEVVTVTGYNEDGTLSVITRWKDNPEKVYSDPAGHHVIGVDPADLVQLPEDRPRREAAS